MSTNSKSMRFISNSLKKKESRVIFCKFKFLDSGKIGRTLNQVVAVFADKHGMNLIVTDGTIYHSFSLFRLYKNHWIELQAFTIDDAFATASLWFLEMPTYMPLKISGRFFLFLDISNKMGKKVFNVFSLERRTS